MKLFEKQDAHLRIKRDNENLIDQNMRVRSNLSSMFKKLENAKNNYDEDKMKALQDFENFIRDITTKKSKALQELAQIEKEIEVKKDIYYGLVEKQDALEERMYQANQREEKLNQRESFVGELEKNFNNKAYGR